jgi:multidrug efflux system membrane fusion protein
VTTGTIRMRATFANPDGVLFPEQFVNVRLLVDTMTGVTLAPNAAVQLGAAGNFVYLLNDNSTVSKRDIVIGPNDGKRTVISSGLAAGDKVVIDGVDRLRDGAKVNVVDNPPIGAAQGSGQGQEQADPTGSGKSEGQHHRHRHAQPGVGEDSPGAGAASPTAPAVGGAATQSAPPAGATPGAAPAGASTQSAAPASPTPQGASTPSPAPGGATTQGSTR